jgi:hypothetical protein
MWYYKNVGGERCPIVDTFWRSLPNHPSSYFKVITVQALSWIWGLSPTLVSTKD